MEEIQKLKEQNADLLLALRQIRNTTLEEAALICDQSRNSNPRREELASAIRSLMDEISRVTEGGEPIEVWAAKGMTVRHIKTGRLYIVLELAQAKMNGRWCEVVSYRSTSDNRVFVREVEPFCVKFEQVDSYTPSRTNAVNLPDDWVLVMDEVKRATRKFPTWPTDPLHAVAILGEEFGELTKAVLQTTYEPHKVQDGELRTEAIQTAAMALRFLASLNRYQFAQCPQHKQLSAKE